MTLLAKVRQLNFMLILFVCGLAAVGFAMLYSAANGDLDPWARRQMLRFAVGLAIMIAVALVDIRIWLKGAYVIYFGCLVLLVGVEVVGEIGMGAQRWIDLGFFQLQPSEVMKVALVIALARYFHTLTLEEVRRPVLLVAPVLMVLAPAALVMRQPDLGTAVMLVAGSAAVFFLAGVRLWKFGVVIAAGMAMVPIAWHILEDYQRERILTFLDPETDPLGAGYHLLQSKIALGSGGIGGKGFLQGTQTHLNFLPEKQTDFIFTMLAEEFGLVGGLGLIGLYTLIFAYGFAIALRSRSQFGRLLAMGVTTTLFLYVFINIAMVTGLVPVVGVPLPLLSYGGTAMMTMLVGIGLLMGVYIHRDVVIRRHGAADGF